MRKTYHILYCDDELASGFVQNVASKMEDIKYKTTEDVLPALSALEEMEQLDIVITDMDFGHGEERRKDGLVILKEAKKRFPDVLGLILTKHRDLEYPWAEVKFFYDVGIEPRGNRVLFKESDDEITYWERLSMELKSMFEQVDEIKRRTFILDSDIKKSISLFSRIDEQTKKLIAENYTFCDLVSGSGLMEQEVFSNIRQIANIKLNVLIIGERGTGKEATARALHKLSNRNKNAFLTFNCSGEFGSTTSSDPRYEIGLFCGYGEGHGFQGIPKQGKRGILEQADQGTLFLDEIGLIPIHVQRILLRPLDGYAFNRVGDNRETQADVRWIGATNRNIWDEVKAGNIQQDFYDRFKEGIIFMPPLRKRKEDIPLLANYFLNNMKISYPKESSLKSISESALTLLINYDWPGNVRELQSFIKLFLAKYLRGSEIEDKDIASALNEWQKDAQYGTSNDQQTDTVGTLSEQLFSKIIEGKLKKSLPKLSKDHGELIAKDIAVRIIKQLGRLPDEETTQKYFGMTYRAFQQWLIQRKLNLKVIREL